MAGACDTNRFEGVQLVPWRDVNKRWADIVALPIRKAVGFAIGLWLYCAALRMSKPIPTAKRFVISSITTRFWCCCIVAFQCMFPNLLNCWQGFQGCVCLLSVKVKNELDHCSSTLKRLDNCGGWNGY